MLLSLDSFIVLTHVSDHLFLVSSQIAREFCGCNLMFAVILPLSGLTATFNYHSRTTDQMERHEMEMKKLRAVSLLLMECL